MMTTHCSHGSAQRVENAGSGLVAESLQSELGNRAGPL
jgi:hypothetical protein